MEAQPQAPLAPFDCSCCRLNIPGQGRADNRELAISRPLMRYVKPL
jgi:hypothetical protein